MDERRRSRLYCGHPEALQAEADQRLYQLIRQPGSIGERRLEIEFLDPGAEAYCFTFG